jgi:hypothetical protein
MAAVVPASWHACGTPDRFRVRELRRSPLLSYLVSNLRRIVRWHPRASVAVGGDRYSVGYSVVREHAARGSLSAADCRGTGSRIVDPCRTGAARPGTLETWPFLDNAAQALPRLSAHRPMAPETGLLIRRDLYPSSLPAHSGADLPKYRSTMRSRRQH